MPDTTTVPLPDFFISRAGADAPFAGEIGRVLEDAGHRVVLQEWDFANRNFMERMHAALSSGARVIALLSTDYLACQHCEAEWQNAIAGDPLNTGARLIVLRLDSCTPRGLLSALPYWDLGPIRDRPNLVHDMVLTAIRRDRHKGEGTASARYWRAARPLLHPDIRPTSSFTGRQDELRTIDDALWSGATAAVTQPAAVHGLGGIGKSTLAREYAWRQRDRYAGIWWLNAARVKDSTSWEGVEKGLVDLGSIFIRGLGEAQDRAAAARQTLDFLAHGGFAKPWLLVYDNVDDAAVLRHWAPLGNAHLLMTTRLRGFGAGIARVEVEELALADAIAYLRADSGRSDVGAAQAEAIATELGRLPLALSHAAAYLRENENATAQSYLAAIARHMRKAPESAEYSRAVFATFQEQAAQAEARAPGARAVLSLAAFFAPDDIPEELFAQDPERYPAAMAEVTASPVALEQAIGALNRFSLVDYAAGTRTFSVHRLVQAATRDALAGEEQWVQGALAAAVAAFPEPEFDTWAACERLISHVRAVASQVATDSLALRWLLRAAGDYLRERAALADVLPLYQRGLAIAKRLAKADPGNVGRQRELSLSHIKIGDVLRAQGNLRAALDSYQASLAIADQFATADPGNAGSQLTLSLSHEKIGDVLRAQGNLPAALDSYQASLAIADQFATADPGNAGSQLTLSLSHEKIGDVLRAQGNLPAALDSYQASLAIRDSLATVDPGNASWQRDLSVSRNKIGDVLRDQGNLQASLDSYQTSLAIRNQFAKANSGNADWQRDLSVSHERIGDVLQDQSNLRAALDSYQASLAIRDRLAKADPGHAGWQHDLSVSHNKVGDVLGAQGNLPAALDSYQASLAIADRLASADPGHAGWQRDLALSHGRVGMIAARQGARDNALKAFQEGRAIIVRLKAQSPDNAILPRDLAWFDREIGQLER